MHLCERITKIVINGDRGFFFFALTVEMVFGGNSVGKDKKKRQEKPSESVGPRKENQNLVSARKA